jgi:hypothetical protein
MCDSFLVGARLLRSGDELKTAILCRAETEDPAVVS